MASKKVTGTKRDTPITAAKKRAPAEKAVKKAVSKKRSPIKREIDRKTSQRSNARAPKRRLPKPPESVALPATAPKRIKEKVTIVRQWLNGRVDDWFIRTARYGGLFFVVVGAMATLWSLSPANDMRLSGQAAATLDSTSSTTDSTTDDSSTTDPEPDATFDVTVTTSDPAVLSVLVYVPYADEVTVLALHKDTNIIYTLGTAALVNSDQWELSWDTLQYPNGTYQLLAEISNEFGVYTEHDTTTYDIYNESNDTTSTTPAVENVTFSLLEGEELIGDTDIIIDAPGYESVELFARQKSTGTAHPIKQVQADPATGVFGFFWDTTGYTDDEYVMEARLYYESTADALEGPRVFVNNTDEVTNEPAADEPDKNNVTFSLDPDQTLSGDVPLTVSAPGYDDVKVLVIAKDTGQVYHFELVSHSESTDTWEFLWRTAEGPDGEYNGKAELYYSGTVETHQGPRLFVDNGSEITTDEIATTSSEDTLTASDSPRLSVPSGPLGGMVSVRVDGEAEFIELYARPVFGITYQFLGLAKQIEPGRWSYAFDTTQLPNGWYDLYAKAGTPSGFLNSEAVRREMLNELSTSNGSTIDSSATEELRTVVDETESTVLFNNESEIATVSEEGVETVEVGTLLTQLLKEYQAEIDSVLQRLTSAVRSQNESQIRTAKNEMVELRKAILKAALSEAENREYIGALDEELRREFGRLQTKIETTEMIIRERTDNNITRDRDQDGITDYDETQLYQTDPLLADTDGDGFTDGAEILRGYDPLDPSPEAIVRHQSPKEAGVEREDVLRVESIEAVVEDVEETDDTPVRALIRGTALPNSYVTLYIYSTPTIVTIKTEADGSWTYQFDKELEDGEHEVYVGITDNAGKIVAKSFPFRFVKEAQAFTPVDTTAGATITTEPRTERISSTNSLLTVTSIAVVAIGLILILIGWNLDATRPRRKASPQTP